MDASKKLFLVASKFKSEIPPIILQYNILFLTVIHQISQRVLAEFNDLLIIPLHFECSEYLH